MLSQIYLLFRLANWLTNLRQGLHESLLEKSGVGRGRRAQQARTTELTALWRLPKGVCEQTWAPRAHLAPLERKLRGETLDGLLSGPAEVDPALLHEYGKGCVAQVIRFL